jgi:hypothetical protein
VYDAKGCREEARNENEGEEAQAQHPRSKQMQLPVRRSMEGVQMGAVQWEAGSGDLSGGWPPVGLDLGGCRGGSWSWEMHVKVRYCFEP